MKAVVTGGAGFIGSHIVDAYVARGWDVIVVDNLVTGDRANVNPNTRFRRLDYTTAGFASLLRKERPDVVNHQAGQTLIHVATRNPRFDAEVNIRGNLSLLEACVAAGVKKLIFASSAGIYGQARTMPIRETTPPAPVNPYAITKAASEWYIRYFEREHGLNSTILRYGNVFGPRDRVASDHVITMFAAALLGGRTPRIDWDGRQSKDFVYVGDVAQASVKAVRLGAGATFNIASGIPRSVNEIYRAVSRELNLVCRPIRAPRRAGDVRTAYFDVSAARRILRWTPTTPFAEGLRVTLRWFVGAAS